ncbi:MAG: hypothetical protein ACRD12_06870, partial [Acidimicrobiales bacterium]
MAMRAGRSRWRALACASGLAATALLAVPPPAQSAPSKPSPGSALQALAPTAGPGLSSVRVDA